MNSRRFIFAGNRFFVLKEMLDAGLHLQKILAVQGSHLAKELSIRNIDHIVIASKKELLQHLNTSDFDDFLANGCPYILPIVELAKDGKRFINIHPAYLPDLRGADPVPGALLLGRDSGATCHLMDEGVDTGAIISQVRIPYSSDLDAPLLYQLSFMAEREVFHLAQERNFEPMRAQEKKENLVYYTKKPEDLRIDFRQSAEAIVLRIRAFNNVSQGAFFSIGNAIFKVYDAEVMTNPYMLAKSSGYKENTVVLAYEKTLLIKKAPGYLKLKNVTGDFSLIKTGIALT